MRNESGLLDVRELHGYLMVRHREVEGAEHCGTSERVEGLIESRERETIKLRYRIETPVVHSHAPSAILLADHDHRRCPRRGRGARNLGGHKLLGF